MNSPLRTSPLRRIVCFFTSPEGHSLYELIGDEATAYYAETLFGTERAVELLLGEKPTLSEKILSFFKGAARDYAADPKLAREARRQLRQFKALFDSFSARNFGRNAEGGTEQQKNVRFAMNIKEFASSNDISWKNVAYEDSETKAEITSQIHEKMVEEGLVVKIPDEIKSKVSESYPDLKGMKKKERLPILKDSIKQLKSNLRAFLSKLKGETFEFEVEGNVLEAKLYNVGIDEVLEKVTQDKAEMLYTTEEIFKNSRYLYSTPDYDGDPNIYRWNYFYTPVQLGESIVGVRIAIRDMVNPRESQIYNWGIKKDTSLDGTGRGTNDRSSYGISSDVSSNTIIDDSTAKSNTSGENSSKKSENSAKRASMDAGYLSEIDDIDADFEKIDKWFESLSLKDLEEFVRENSKRDSASVGEWINDISEEADVPPKKVEIYFRRSGLGNSYVEDGKKAVMTQKRIDESIDDYGASRPDYAQKYITRISPEDFIDLTVYRKNQNRAVFDTIVQGDHGSTMADWDYVKALHDSRNPWLEIRMSTGEIIGHNGRHRIRALEMAGIESVEIEVQFFDDDGRVIKTRAEIIPDLVISSQFDTATSTHISNIIPFNESFREDIEKYYGEKKNPKAAVRYSMEPTATESEAKAELPRKAARADMTVGQLKKYLANFSRAKTYSRKDALNVVGKIDAGNALTEKTRGDIAEAIWQIYNEALTSTERQAAARDIARYFSLKLFSESKVENPDAKKAEEDLVYLSAGIGSLYFTEEQKNEIKHREDSDGLKRIVGRWGFKGERTRKNGTTVKRTPLDVFVVDIAREMPGMQYLEDMNPVDAFLQIDQVYTATKEIALDKTMSAYWDVPESEIENIARENNQKPPFEKYFS